MNNKQEEYEQCIDQMINSKKGTLLGYLKEFLLKKKYDDWWSQPEAMKFINERVVKDGGVGWWKGVDKGKKNPDGSPANFGDGGRNVEKFRQEDYEGCFDTKNSKREGPFRLNIQKYNEYKGSTKSHSFSEEIKNFVKKRSKGRCELCGHKGKLEIDHFIPKEKGGESTLENANALCGRCNDKKCAMEPREFMKKEFERQKKYWEERGMGKEFNELR